MDFVSVMLIGSVMGELLGKALKAVSGFYGGRDMIGAMIIVDLDSYDESSEDPTASTGTRFHGIDRPTTADERRLMAKIMRNIADDIDNGKFGYTL